MCAIYRISTRRHWIDPRGVCVAVIIIYVSLALSTSVPPWITFTPVLHVCSSLIPVRHRRPINDSSTTWLIPFPVADKKCIRTNLEAQSFIILPPHKGIVESYLRITFQNFLCAVVFRASNVQRPGGFCVCWKTERLPPFKCDDNDKCLAERRNTSHTNCRRKPQRTHS